MNEPAIQPNCHTSIAGSRDRSHGPAKKLGRDPDPDALDEVAIQRNYYATTAGSYDQQHISVEEPEHDLALDILGAIAAKKRFGSFLDVGSGTGRGMMQMASLFPEAHVTGIEPVAELRKVGHGKGVPDKWLIEGDATAIQFADASFDCVFALGVMHHLPNPRKALTEMLRVAKRAVFISDMNNFGCGPLAQRLFSHAVRSVGLWKALQFVKNGFKHWKYSEGDGVHYSYSLFDDISFLASHGVTCRLFTTRPTGSNPFWTCSHIAVLAEKD